MACNDTLIGFSLTPDAANYLCDTIATAQESLDGTNALAMRAAEGATSSFTILSGALVFIMHGGFAMLCAGMIRSKNTMNILLMTVMDAMISGIMWYLIGFGIGLGGYNPFNPLSTFNSGGETAEYSDYLAGGSKSNNVIGTSLFAMSNYSANWPFNNYAPATSGFGSLSGDSPVVVRWQDWFYSYTFAATATTIPAGAVAERFNFNAYLGYATFISGWVYPMVVHWFWSLYGWGSPWRFALGLKTLFNATGVYDFAGSGVVHMVGGIAGLWGAVLVGPRMGRFDSNGHPVQMPGHSATLVVLGTVLLWFGWYGFNPASIGSITYTLNAVQVSGRAAVTTTLSGCAAGTTALFLSFIRSKSWDLLAVSNGVLSGFVGITAGCGVVEPWAAIVCGVTSCMVFQFFEWGLLKLKVDDPLSAAALHGGTGMWGVFFTGLLAKVEYATQIYATRQGMPAYGGAFYPGNGGKLLACQCIEILAIFAWVSGNMIPFFYIFKMFGQLRISAEEEQQGLDHSKHGGSAYNQDYGLNTNKPQGIP